MGVKDNTQSNALIASWGFTRKGFIWYHFFYHFWQFHVDFGEVAAGSWGLDLDQWILFWAS